MGASFPSLKVHGSRERLGAMAFDYNAGGHAFGWTDDVCAKCGMTRRQFEATGKPRCTERKRMTIPDDDGDTGEKFFPVTVD